MTVCVPAGRARGFVAEVLEGAGGLSLPNLGPLGGQWPRRCKVRQRTKNISWFIFFYFFFLLLLKKKAKNKKRLRKQNFDLHLDSPILEIEDKFAFFFPPHL